jgi:hypothetical protein
MEPPAAIVPFDTAVAAVIALLHAAAAGSAEHSRAAG